MSRGESVGDKNRIVLREILDNVVAELRVVSEITSSLVDVFGYGVVAFAADDRLTVAVKID